MQVHLRNSALDNASKLIPFTYTYCTMQIYKA
jgi:hypothetical protein